MVHKNLEVIWLNVRMLGRTSEKVLRVLHDELVERRRGRNEHRAGCPAAPRTPGTLPSGSNRTRITRHHTSVQRPNIDPQLQCIRGHDSADSAFAQPTFNLAPFPRQVAPAIAADRFRLARLWRIRLLQIREQDFRVQSTIGEDNRLQLACKQFFSYPCGFIDIAASNAKVAVDHRRIVENEKFFPSRRAILFDYVDLTLNQL